MHDIFSQLDFNNIPFPAEYKSFVSREFEGKLFRKPGPAGDNKNYSFPYISRGGQGLGDVISTVQFAYHISEVYYQPVGISWKAWKPREGVLRKTKELIPALGQNFSDRVFVTDDVWKNYGKAMWPWYYAPPYFKADKTWQGDNSRVAVLQLDGKTSGGDKNLPKEQIPLLEEFLKSLGYKVRYLEFKDEKGDYVPMRKWVEILSEAEIFFGVCSGGLHMAHCVGIPKVVFTNNYDYSILDPDKSSHRNESFVHFKDFHEMEGNLK